MAPSQVIPVMVWRPSPPAICYYLISILGSMYLPIWRNIPGSLCWQSSCSMVSTLASINLICFPCYSRNPSLPKWASSHCLGLSIIFIIPTYRLVMFLLALIILCTYFINWLILFLVDCKTFCEKFRPLMRTETLCTRNLFSRAWHMLRMDEWMNDYRVQALNTI